MRVETKYEIEDSEEEPGVLLLDSSSQEEFVVNTKDVCDMGLVGGKAYNISQIARKDFAVPNGFCVTTRAYDYFKNFNSISEESEETSNRIKEALIPPFLAEIICDAYNRYLDGKPCAVRSSSTSEDLKDASFAGQYKSFLNIKSEDALLDAVKECWASLWSQRAIEYRKKMGIENENVKMAVLVQEMLPAEASGVLFTEDPMVVEAVWGLGDILVGGRVIPDHFVVERKEFKEVERRISNKEIMSQLDSAGGLTVKEVPEHLRDVPVLENDMIRELCILGKNVEDIFGCPQDIEWALSNGRIILLQARPITVKQKPTVWSRANISETQPGYITYLSRPPENRPDFYVFSTLPILENFGITEIPENVKFVEYIYGHAYMNMTNVHSILCRIPGLPPELLNEGVGHRDSEEALNPQLGIFDILKLLPGTVRVIRFILSLPDKAEEIIAFSTEFIRDTKTRHLKEMSLEELEKLVWEMHDRNQKVFQVHSCNALASGIMVNILQKILKRAGEEDSENLLITGLEGMSTYRLGVEMWKLSQKAKKSPRVSELILSRRENVLENLKEFSEGRDFLRDLDDFLERFGDRCSAEPELSNPRWREDISFVLSMAANYLNSETSHVLDLEKEKELRLEAKNHILKKLSKNPVEKLLFRKLLDRYQQYLTTRENLKTTWATGLSTMRLLYMAIASKLVEKGILETKDDIFYLKMTEVSDVIAGNLRKEQIEGLIADRRKEKEECEYLEVPMTIVGKPPHIEELKYTVEPKKTLEGTGGSYGVVTGRARVALDPRECLEFKEGEILVASVTDPGWSPLFVIAGGLVMELGSYASHAIIIAREYGVPTVVGVKNATKIIRSGQLITVDGTKGMVYIRE